MAAVLKKSRAKGKKPPAKNKGGRPRATVDIEQLGNLGALQCTRDEAASVLGVSLATLRNRLSEEKYRDAWEQGKDKGKASLRRTQFRLAEKSAAMAIFLGKQYLGQRDVSELEHSGALNITGIKVTIVDP